MTQIIFFPKENPDDLYEGFDKNLYRIDPGALPDDVMRQLQANSGADNSQNVTVSASDFGSGVDTSMTVSATGSYAVGKKLFDNTDPGFILGFDPKDGLSKFYIGNSTNYFNWNGSTVTITGNTSAAITLAQATGAGINLVMNSGGVLFKVGSDTNAGIGLIVGSTPFNQGTLNLQLGSDSNNWANLNFHWQALHTADVSPQNGELGWDLGTATDRWRYIYLLNAPNVSSDIRFKSDIRPSEYGLGSVLRMEPIQYKKDGNQHIGFSAQAMEQVVPEVVEKNDKGLYSMRYEELIPVLVRAVQDLSAKVDELERKSGV